MKASDTNTHAPPLGKGKLFIEKTPLSVSRFNGGGQLLGRVFIVSISASTIAVSVSIFSVLSKSDVCRRSLMAISAVWYLRAKTKQESAEEEKNDSRSPLTTTQHFLRWWNLKILIFHSLSAASFWWKWTQMAVALRIAKNHHLQSNVWALAELFSASLGRDERKVSRLFSVVLFNYT